MHFCPDRVVHYGVLFLRRYGVTTRLRVELENNSMSLFIAALFDEPAGAVREKLYSYEE